VKSRPARVKFPRRYFKNKIQKTKQNKRLGACLKWEALAKCKALGSILSTKGKKRSTHVGWAKWLTPVILAIWEAEMGRIVVRGWPRQIVLEIPSPK
jgi:hypothetical protein